MHTYGMNAERIHTLNHIIYVFDRYSYIVVMSLETLTPFCH